MSTKGVYGFKINNETKCFINFYDSYPGKLGNQFLNFLINNDLERVKKLCLSLSEYDNKKINNVSKDLYFLNKIRSIDFWNDTSQVLSYFNKGLITYFNNAENMLQNHISCEYAYIYNFDNHIFEVYINGDVKAVEFRLDSIPNNWNRMVENFSEKNRDRISEYMIKYVESQSF